MSTRRPTARRRCLRRQRYHTSSASTRLHVTLSIGISVCPDDGRDAETMLKNADMAMYHAKKMGRNNYQFFTQT